MARPVELPETMEATVRFIEDTPPASIVEATIAKLDADDASPAELLAASALAVSRSTELPADHHGGPVHPVSGLHAIHHTGAWLSGDWARMPIIHSVALANRHVHSPEMGPMIMPRLTPEPSLPGPREEGLDALQRAIRSSRPLLAERLLLGLIETCSPGEILDAMLDTALRRNGIDDHYFLYTVHAMRGLRCIGWEWAPVVLRPVVRYLSTNMRTVPDRESGFDRHYVEGNLSVYHAFWRLEKLIEDHRLLDPAKRPAGGDESAAVGALGERIGACERFADIPAMSAEALAEGLSLAGAGEAISYGAALLHLRTDYGNPFDVHLHTGINTRRHLLEVPEVSLRNKLLGLLSWACGPEIRLCEHRVRWSWRFESDAHRGRGREELLDAIARSITGKASVDRSASVEQLYCGEEARETMALARAYTDAGHDPDALFQRLGELVCRDDYSEMHAFKHLQAAHEEYENTRERYRWAHLVSAAKMAWCTYGFGQEVYERARRRLAI